MNVIYFVWYFSIFYYTFSNILATNIDSITSYSKIREEIKSMYVCILSSLMFSDPNGTATVSKSKAHDTFLFYQGVLLSC